MKMKSRCSIVHGCKHIEHDGYFRLGCIRVKEEIVKTVTVIHREGRQNFRDQRMDMSCAHY